MNTDEFENAMNEGRIERKHCKWMLAEVKRLRGLLRQLQRCTACGRSLGQCNIEEECIDAGGWPN